jgi:starch synthase
MPSRFEPCGLAQQYAMKYGSIPVARRTGGLADTIVDFDEDKNLANGLLFEQSTSTELIHVINRAINLFHMPDKFQKVRKTGLNSQFSWELAAKQYTKVYNWALEDK